MPCLPLTVTCISKTYAHERTQTHTHAHTYSRKHICVGDIHIFIAYFRGQRQLTVSWRCLCRGDCVRVRVCVCEGMLKFICQKDYHGNRVLSISEQTFAAFYSYASDAPFVMCRFVCTSPFRFARSLFMFYVTFCFCFRLCFVLAN